MNQLNSEVKATIPKIWLNGEWCENEGHNGHYFVFRRHCGEAYYLNNIQLENHLSDLIGQF